MRTEIRQGAIVVHDVHLEQDYPDIKRYEVELACKYVGDTYDWAYDDHLGLSIVPEPSRSLNLNDNIAEDTDIVFFVDSEDGPRVDWYMVYTANKSTVQVILYRIERDSLKPNPNVEL